MNGEGASVSGAGTPEIVEATTVAPNSSAAPAPGSAGIYSAKTEKEIESLVSKMLSDIERRHAIGDTAPAPGSAGVYSEKTDEEIKSIVSEMLSHAAMSGMTGMHVAAFKGDRHLMKTLMSRPRLPNDVNAMNAEGQTPLHLAALTGQLEIVELLLTQPNLRVAVEDESLQTAFEIAIELEWHDIVRVLLQNRGVTNYLDARRADRAVYGNGTNAILVAAALIAGITFAGWLQPPLGYQRYYQYPRNKTMPGAPPDDFQQYAAISEHLSVKVFWISNSLSFYFAIAAILSGAAALVPRGTLHELAEGRRLRGAVYLAGFSLSWAALFVFVAFTAAGFASLPPIVKYEVYMIVTLVIGFIICLHGFSSARISDPFVFGKYSFIIDPTFYLSKLSGALEWCCECFPGLHYQSVESRIRKRKNLYEKLSSVKSPANEGVETV